MTRLANTLRDGLMSSTDYNKILQFPRDVPSLQLTIGGRTILSGVVRFATTDQYIMVSDHSEIYDGGDVIQIIPNYMYGDTYLVDISINLSNLIVDMEQSGRLKRRGKTGPKGFTGPRGEDGPNMVFAGPSGNKGETGDRPPLVLELQPDVVENVITGGLGITDIRPLPIDDQSFVLELTRQPLGSSTATTNIFKTPLRNWTTVVVFGAGSNVNFMDVVPALDAVYNRANEYGDLIAAGYEKATKFWLERMRDTYELHRKAMCCSLERCISRTKNLSLKRHYESVIATAKISRSSVKINRKRAKGIVRRDGDINLADMLENEADCNRPRCVGKVQLAFLIDDSGSMTPIITEVAQELDSILGALFGQAQFDSKIAVVRFAETSRILQGFTNNETSIRDVLDKLKVQNTEWLEAHGRAIDFTVANLGWDSDSDLNIILLISDEVSVESATEVSDKIKAAFAAGIEVAIGYPDHFSGAPGQEFWDDVATQSGAPLFGSTGSNSFGAEMTQIIYDLCLRLSSSSLAIDATTVQSLVVDDDVVIIDTALPRAGKGIVWKNLPAGDYEFITQSGQFEAGDYYSLYYNLILPGDIYVRSADRSLYSSIETVNRSSNTIRVSTTGGLVHFDVPRQQIPITGGNISIKINKL